jgi:hypothetical protein
VIDDSQYEKLSISFGPRAAVVGDYTSPQLVYGDSSGMQVKVAADRYALVRGHEWWSGSTIFTKAIASNSSGSTRTDLVVLRLSRTTWDVTTVVITGTPGGGAPSPTQDLSTTGSFDLPLATVTVASGASSISAANVTYVATHVGTDGNLRIPSLSGLSYVPNPYAGLTVSMDPTGQQVRKNASGWEFSVGPRTTVTPTLTAATTNPTMGTGAERYGWWAYGPGPSVSYNWFIKFGTSPNAGSGAYAISAPIPCATVYAGGHPAVGTVMLADASTGTFTVNAAYIGNGASTIAMVGSAPVTSTFPWTWAAGDYLAGSITYPS